MDNSTFYIWLAILLVYIISPLDLFPGFIDDLIAIGLIYYLSFRKKAPRKDGGRGRRPSGDGRPPCREELSLDDAYRILGVSPDASWQDIKRAYKEKMAKCHPDKVSHLNEELQEKARELTLELNNALEVIRKRTGVERAGA